MKLDGGGWMMKINLRRGVVKKSFDGRETANG
jgi:hypothetical protein